jgi:hypothetical protein
MPLNNKCEQYKCSKSETTEQYYCCKCDMELCGVCIYEHRKEYSISGLECDNSILIGSRDEN